MYLMTSSLTHVSALFPDQLLTCRPAFSLQSRLKSATKDCESSLVKSRLIREKNLSPLLSPPTEMPLCPLQTGNPMTCCKHLFHIGPPWPNGLPGLPEAAQHCLFADTVLPCRTCRCLKTTSKVLSVMNLSVRQFVTLGLPGPRRSATSPVCWKRWRNRIIVFLLQPNALLTLETSSLMLEFADFDSV